MIDPQPTSLSQPPRPPHSSESEQAVCGAILISARALDTAASILSEFDFYTEKHRLIFRAANEYQDRGEPVDAITLVQWFSDNGMLDVVQNGAYLTMLANECPGASNVKSYCEIIRNKAGLRKLVQMGSEMADRAMTEPDPYKIASDVSVELLDADRIRTGEPKTIKQVAASWFNHLEQMLDESVRINTGIVDLDARWNGMHPSDLIIIAGRPGMGKTTLAMSIAEHVAKQHHVHVITQEMDNEQLFKRQVAHKVDSEKLRNPKLLTEEDWKAIRERMIETRDLKMLYEDEPGLTINKLSAMARAAHRKYDTKLIIVDYLQLLEGSGENRTQQIGAVSRGLKKLAKQLRVPIIAVSQLNRSLESRQDKRPMMSDLREAGQIEQDADVICFVYRENAYKENFKSWCTELITAKFRDGQTGTDLAMMQPTKQRFVSPDEDAKADYWSELQQENAPKTQSAWQKSRAKGAKGPSYDD